MGDDQGWNPHQESSTSKNNSLEYLFPLYLFNKHLHLADIAFNTEISGESYVYMHAMDGYSDHSIDSYS